MLITRTSAITGVEHTMEINVTYSDLARIQDGMLIQDALPHLTPDEREFILNGITAEEWDDAFPTEDGWHNDEEMPF